MSETKFQTRNITSKIVVLCSLYYIPLLVVVANAAKVIILIIIIIIIIPYSQSVMIYMAWLDWSGSG
jgi:hypothetical protein